MPGIKGWKRTIDEMENDGEEEAGVVRDGREKNKKGGEKQWRKKRAEIEGIEAGRRM